MISFLFICLYFVQVLILFSFTSTLVHSFNMRTFRKLNGFRCNYGRLYSSNRESNTKEVISGLLPVYKPQNWTSHDVVGTIRYILTQGARKHINARVKKVKVGHGGTLDPMAEGVLVLGIGEGTKLLASSLKGNKSYRAVGLFGKNTDTLDAMGNITASMSEDEINQVSLDDIEAVLSSFRGDILQTPPMYSALKKGGKKLYELARQGIDIEREARPVTVHRLEIVRDPNIKWPNFCLDIESGGGFYVRSVISDIAEKVT